MRTNERVDAVERRFAGRPPIATQKVASRKSTPILHSDVKTLDDWNAWMRARGRYQTDSED